MNLWTPPSRSSRSAPGRSMRWYVLLRMISGPTAEGALPSCLSCSVVRLFTDASVPTGMKTGVSIVPWGVVTRPRRAAPSVWSNSNVNRDSSLGTRHSALLKLHRFNARVRRETQGEAALGHRHVDLDVRE